MGAKSGPIRVLVVLSSNARRGAEIEGERLAQDLSGTDFLARAVSLSVAASSGALLKVEVLGERPLALRTLRGLRHHARSVDIVVAYGSSALPACALALFALSTPFIYRSIGDPRHWVRGRLHQERTGLLMRRAARVVALYDGAATSIRDLYRLAPDRVVVIPNARSAVEFNPVTQAERETARRELSLDPEGLVAVVVGALSEEKRVDLAMRAVAVLKNFTLLVAGDGPLREGLEELGLSLLGDRVRFLGALADVRPVYHAADVVVLSSSTEGMPGTAIEAGMSGVPVASCDVGAMSWLFEQGLQGALCSQEATASELADTVQQAAAVGVPCTVLEACKWEHFVAAWRQQLRDIAT